MKKIGYGIIILFLAGICFSTTTPPAPTKQQLYGTWIGFTSDMTDSFRMVLKEPGGFLSWLDVSTRPKPYKIDSWDVRPQSLLIMTLSPMSDGEPIIIEAHAASHKLEFKIMGSGREKGWVEHVTLYREEAIESRISTLKESMKTLH